jgi:hypothetical protein
MIAFWEFIGKEGFFLLCFLLLLVMFIGSAIQENK